MKNNSPIYVIPKKIHTPAPWGTFVLDPPLPWNFHSRGCSSYHLLEFPLLFNLTRYPLERIFLSKMLLYFIIMQKNNFFAAIK